MKIYRPIFAKEMKHIAKYTTPKSCKKKFTEYCLYEKIIFCGWISEIILIKVIIPDPTLTDIRTDKTWKYSAENKIRT